MRVRKVAATAAVWVLVVVGSWVVLVALAVAIAVPVFDLVTPDAAPVQAPVSDAARVIHEDDPEWECATMGNRVCMAWNGVNQDTAAACGYFDGWGEPECVVAELGRPGETLRDTMRRLGY